MGAAITPTFSSPLLWGAFCSFNEKNPAMQRLPSDMSCSAQMYKRRLLLPLFFLSSRGCQCTSFAFSSSSCPVQWVHRSVSTADTAASSLPRLFVRARSTSLCARPCPRAVFRSLSLPQVFCHHVVSMWQVWRRFPQRVARMPIIKGKAYYTLRFAATTHTRSIQREQTQDMSYRV